MTNWYYYDQWEDVKYPYALTLAESSGINQLPSPSSNVNLLTELCHPPIFITSSSQYF